MRRACGDAHMKTILATGELGPLWQVAKASKVCMMAGADFIKTSTGKEAVNATLEVGLTMVREIRAYQDMTGYQIGFKPAGGIRSAKDALNWLILIKEELGDAWLNNRLFRFGASRFTNRYRTSTFSSPQRTLCRSTPLSHELALSGRVAET